MRIAFHRCMMQRYRAILNLVEVISAYGHELTLVVSTKKKINIEDFRRRPCDASISSPNTVKYIGEAIGINTPSLDFVKYTTDKRIKADLHLDIDDRNQDRGAFGIPYMGESCWWKGEPIKTGNPMSELIRNDKEIPGTALIVHPGGGRGYVSPVRSDISKNRITENNIELLQNVIDSLPSHITPVTIKTHPVPGIRCTKSAIEKFVVPELKFSGKIEVRDIDLIGLINSHEYILNFGGTTALWVKNTGKKWANIKGCVKYPSKTQRERLLNERGGGIELSEIKNIEASPYVESGGTVKRIIDMINTVGNK